MLRLSMIPWCSQQLQKLAGRRVGPLMCGSLKGCTGHSSSNTDKYKERHKVKPNCPVPGSIYNKKLRAAIYQSVTIWGNSSHKQSFCRKINTDTNCVTQWYIEKTPSINLEVTAKWLTDSVVCSQQPGDHFHVFQSFSMNSSGSWCSSRVGTPKP